MAEDPMYHLSVETSEEFNWEELRKDPNDPYFVDVGDIYYIFNVGSNLKETCNGQKASSIKKSKFSDYCEVVGTTDKVSFRLINHHNKGIAIEYWTKERCNNWNEYMSYKKTTISLICSDEEYDFELVSRTDTCEVEFAKKTYMGCPQKYTPFVWLRVVWSILGAILVVSTLFACMTCIFEDDYWDEEETREPEQSGPVWREMKTIVRKGKNWGKSVSFI